MTVRPTVRWLSWVVMMNCITAAVAAEFHVQPDGSATGNGSASAPWDLATALNAKDTVQPGDTVWIHAGTYRGGFVSRLSGRADAPVIIRGMRGERVTIDTQPRDDKDNGLFLIAGPDAVYRDFEVTCSHPTRETRIPGSWPEDIRRGNIDVRADRVSVLNLIVHDCASGFGFWSEAEGGEVSGCLIFNNGWRGPDRGHGHAVYAQNARGTKRIRDNVIFHQFAYGVHVYGSEKASLKGFEIDGNIVFENGCLTRPGDHAPGIMVGGGCPAERIAVRDNIVTGGGIRLGYPWGTTNDDLVCTGNYSEGLVVRDFRRGIVERNTIVAHSNAAQLEAADRLLLSGLKWNDNDYFITDGRWGQCSVTEGSKSRGLSFEEWRTITGFDSRSTLTKGRPATQRSIIRPNAHEPGRAHIAVLNPAGLSEVEVDLSSVLQPGTKYRIVSVKDFFGPALITGTWDNRPVRIPLRPVTPPQPVGMSGVEFPVTEPHFAAFVVMSGS